MERSAAAAAAGARPNSANHGAAADRFLRRPPSNPAYMGGAPPRSHSPSPSFLPQNHNHRNVNDAPSTSISFRHSTSSSLRRPTNTGPGFVLHRPRRTNTKDSLPGPASYYVNSRFTHPSPPAFTFGAHLRRSRLPSDAAFTPGPGAYSLRCSPAGPFFSITGREADGFRRNDTPGPGAYYQQRYPGTGPSYSLGGRLQEGMANGRRSASPGPGAYYHEDKPAGPSFSLLSRLNHSNGGRLSDGTPGPGTYHFYSRPSSPAFSLTSKAADRSREAAAASMPGPGAYTLPPTMEGPAFSLLARVAPPGRGAETPGPGRYNVGSRPESPAFSFGARIGEAGAAERSRSPGPGAYECSGPGGGGRRGIGFSFGTKLSGGKRVLGPGPGSYEQGQKPSGPAHSIHGRLATASASAAWRGFPGPGAYNVATGKPDGPAYTLHGRTAVRMWGAQTPGPGTYEPSASYVRHAAPKFTLGHRLSPVGAGELESRPGPGAYSPTLPPDAPAFSMLARF